MLRPHKTLALALGLVFHELVTNAVKYGALAKSSGRIAVTWEIEKGRLHINWLERDGPAVKKPRRRGFGTELIERELQAPQRNEVVDGCFLLG